MSRFALLSIEDDDSPAVPQATPKPAPKAANGSSAEPKKAREPARAVPGLKAPKKSAAQDSAATEAPAGSEPVRDDRSASTSAFKTFPLTLVSQPLDRAVSVRLALVAEEAEREGVAVAAALDRTVTRTLAFSPSQASFR